MDRFVFQAMDEFWHNECLKCTCCTAKLADIGSTCFFKGGMILCKEDYVKLVWLGKRVKNAVIIIHNSNISVFIRVWLIKNILFRIYFNIIATCVDTFTNCNYIKIYSKTYVFYLPNPDKNRFIIEFKIKMPIID